MSACCLTASPRKSFLYNLLRPRRAESGARPLHLCDGAELALQKPVDRHGFVSAVLEWA